jgi:small subunit ribosomal protein S20
MATHKSAAKRNRQRIVHTTRTKAFRSVVRGAIKAAHAAIAGESDDAKELVRYATSLLDKAATKNAIPTKRASRLKGRLASRLHGASKA